LIRKDIFRNQLYEKGNLQKKLLASTKIDYYNMPMENILKNSLIWSGRTLDIDGVRYFDYSASSFEFAFTGTKAVCTFCSDPESWQNDTKCWLGVYVSEIDANSEKKPLDFWKDFPEEPDRKILLNHKKADYTLFECSKPKTVHIRVIKLSEAAFAYAGFCGLKLEGRLLENCINTAKNEKKLKKPRIQFIGDSITCGYGIDGVFEKDVFTTEQERADKSFAFLTAKELGAEFQMVSWSGIGIISCYVDIDQNCPRTEILMPLLYPYTDKSLSLRLNAEPEIWPACNFKPDIVVINLGTNDASYTRQKEERVCSFISGYRQLLENVHRDSPSASIAACLGVMGQDLCDAVENAVSLFKNDFPKVQVSVLKFDVQDEKDGIGADWHPSAKTHKKLAQKLVIHLKQHYLL